LKVCQKLRSKYVQNKRDFFLVCWPMSLCYIHRLKIWASVYSCISKVDYIQSSLEAGRIDFSPRKTTTKDKSLDHWFVMHSLWARVSTKTVKKNQLLSVICCRLRWWDDMKCRKNFNKKWTCNTFSICFFYFCTMIFSVI